MGLDGKTYVPDPCLLSSTCIEISCVIAARKAVRETPSRSESTRSEGSLSPPTRPALRI